MNTADRSLALVDYALRRRFAFSTVEPAFGSQGFDRHLADGGVPEPIRRRITTRLETLNQQIREHPQLGEGFQIGHSYFCRPPEDLADSAAWNGWYTDVVRYEIEPLLREYWFDDAERARNALTRPACRRLTSRHEDSPGEPVLRSLLRMGTAGPTGGRTGRRAYFHVRLAAEPVGPTPSRQLSLRCCDVAWIEVYRERAEDTRRPRGKLDLPSTVRRALRLRGQVRVRFEELSRDVLHNRIVQTTMLRLAAVEELNAGPEGEV